MTVTDFITAGKNENNQIRGAVNALVRSKVNLPAANITFPDVAGASSTSCPGSNNPAGVVCSSISVKFLLRYNTSSFPTPPGQGAADAVSAAINGGLLQCRLAQLYPTSLVTIRTGGVCPETSLPPALAPTRAPTSRFNSFATLSNNFFIFNTAGITSATLNTSGNLQSRKLAKAYRSLLGKTISDIIAKGAILSQASTYVNVTDTTCPAGLVGICQIATAGFILQYDPRDFPGEAPGNTAGTRMQVSINSGNLICEHKLLSPNSPIAVRSGNKCPTDTPAPTPVPSPTAVPTVPPFSTSATITNTFRILHDGSVTIPILSNPTSQAAKELLGAYTSLVTTSLNSFNSQAPVKYGGTKLGPSFSSIACPSSSPAGSVCHSVAATFVLSYTASEFTTAPGAAAGQVVQDAINKGTLDCVLETLSPASVMQVTSGGGCAATNPPSFDSSATITNRFLISNTNNIMASTLQATNNPQKAELAAAYNALITATLASIFASGAVMDGIGTINVFTSTSCPSGTTCHLVDASFKLKYNAIKFPNGGAGTPALNLVQNAINAGSMICYHSKLYPNSLIKVTSGGLCPTPVQRGLRA